LENLGGGNQMNKHPGIEYVRHRKKLQLEGGITQISLENADYFLRHYGLPERIKLQKEDDEYLVLATWPGVTHLFTGFSWGYLYGGEGTSGLNTFFRTCGVFPGFNAYNISENLDNAINGILVVLGNR
jgi:hypothetical protein